jgi:hypothetical protein
MTSDINLIRVKIENGDIVVRFPIESLQFYLNNSLYGGYETGDTGKILDENKFAEEVAGQLECEEEDGSTPVIRLIEGAMREAIEWGTEHVEFEND